MAKSSEKRGNLPKKKVIPPKKQAQVDEFVKNFPLWRKKEIPIAEMAAKSGLRPDEVYAFAIQAAEEFWGISHEDALYRYNGPHKQHIRCGQSSRKGKQEDDQQGTQMSTTMSESMDQTAVSAAQTDETVSNITNVIQHCDPTSVEVQSEANSESRLSKKLKELIEIATKLACMEEK